MNGDLLCWGCFYLYSTLDGDTVVIFIYAQREFSKRIRLNLENVILELQTLKLHFIICVFCYIIIPR